MDVVRGYPIRRFENGHFVEAVDAIIVERRIELDVNDGALRVGLLCLPRDIEALAVGFLAGEGALRMSASLPEVEYLHEDGRVRVRGDFEAGAIARIAERWTRGTGCGSGGTSYLAATESPPVRAGFSMHPEQLLDLAATFQKQSDLWKRTGGVHACALCDEEAIRFLAEDVGRHNAFDKAVGMALMARADPSGYLALTTGRISAEIVSKAIACGIPMLASRSAVTNVAIQLAQRAGMTLVGFVRGARMNVYTGAERIVAEMPAD